MYHDSFNIMYRSTSPKDRPEQPLLLVDGVLLGDERVHIPEVVGPEQVLRATGFGKVIVSSR